MTYHVYSDPALPCVECGEMRNFGAWQDKGGPHERWVCHNCTDGQPMSRFGKQVTREVARR